ncbi:MAG: type II secretion system protein [Campylobacterales bacterium]|nr:type II secretion system protein [Campylobacterales bacterium]HEO98358.1 type II secretion system protein [Campylobacterota bacterium]
MKNRMRRAIAMIELIFAIVILGIVMMSAPMLISTATQSSYVALQQEAIASASAEIGMILTYHWDEGNTDPTRTVSVLVSPNGDGDLNQEMNGTIPTGRRAGTPDSSSRRFFHSLGGGAINTTAPANLGPDGGDRDDIDDFITVATTALIDLNSTSTVIGDVVDKNITIEVKVNYLDDTPGGSSYAGTSNTLTYNTPFDNNITIDSNIKQVQVRLTTTHTEEELQKDIVLNAFSCNIGAYQLRQAVFE